MHTGLSSPPASQELAPLVRSFARWTVLLFLLSLAFHLFCFFILHAGAWEADPFWPLRARFADFTIFASKFQHFGTAAFWRTGFPMTYPAPSALMFELFYGLFGSWALLAFETFCVLAFAVPAALFGAHLVRQGVRLSSAFGFVACLVVFSWPAILVAERGNIEVMVWAVLALGMWAYSTGRLWLAAVLFGLGASLKLFPLTLLGLFLALRRYKELAAGIAAFLLTSLASLAILGPGIASAYRETAAGLTLFKNAYMAIWLPNENGVEHSIFGLYKLTVFTLSHQEKTTFPVALAAYLWITAVGGVGLYVVRIRKLPLLNQIFLLTIASIYLTAFSGDGTLIHLYYPCAMALLLARQAWLDHVKVPGLALVLGCLVFLLSFETFLVYDNQRYIGPAHAIALGILFVATLVYPLGPPLLATSSERILSRPETAWAT